MTKEIFITLILFWIFMVHTQAQTRRNSEKPRLETKIGVGVLPNFLSDWDRTQINVVPLSLEISYRTNQILSIGGFLSYSSADFFKVQELYPQKSRSFRTDFTGKYFVIGLRGAAHYDKLEKWDIYGGFTLAYSQVDVAVNTDISDFPDNLLSPNDQGIKDRSNVFYTAHLGTTFKLTQHLGVFSELSFGNAILTSGLSFRF